MILGRSILIPSIVIYTILILYGLNKKISKEKLFIGSIIYFISIFIIMLTIFPITIDKRIIQSDIELGYEAINNIIPFKTIYNEITSNGYSHIGLSIYQLCGNFIMLFPLGYLIPIMFNKKINFKLIILIIFSISLSIESTQFIIGKFINYNYRSFDIDDIILNTLGGILGYLILKLTYPIIKNFIKIDCFENTDIKNININGTEKI